MKIFRDDHLHFLVWSNSVSSVLSALNTGRTSGIGAVSIHASSRGYAIKLKGRVLAKGHSPEDLHRAFQAEIEKAKAGLRSARQ